MDRMLCHAICGVCIGGLPEGGCPKGKRFGVRDCVGGSAADGA